ncbi:MAG TPA: ATP-binding protein [Candidatus Sulfotelmatobacter sp.]|nr:ATP-binding protein [Candidatus Sulfotelmatobacter sp.]
MPILSRQSLSTAATRAPHRRIWLWVVVLNLLVAGLSGILLYRGYLQHEDRARVASQNLSALLAQTIGAEIDQVGLALAAMADEAQREMAADGIDPDIFNEVLERQQRRLPYLEALRVTDASGVIRYGSQIETLSRRQTPLPDLSDREYFITLKQQSGNADLVISHPLQSRVSQQWDIVVARRYLTPDGRFAGIVYATLPVRHFNEILASLSLGRNGTAILRASQDYALLARFPILDAYGQTKMSQEFLANAQAAPALGTYLAHGAADGVERIFTYRRLSRHPLMVLVGLATQDYVEDWRQDTGKTGLLLCLFLLTTLVGGLSMVKAGQDRQNAFDQLHLLLNSAGIGIFGIDGNGLCTFCNPAALSMFGLTGEGELVGRNLHGLLHYRRQDGTPYPESECPVHHSLDSGVASHGIDHYWRPDGSGFPIEFWVTPQSLGGQVVGAVVSFADITNRKAAENALAEKTRELARSNAELEQFAYVASHDLREPLRMIASYVGLLERHLAKTLDDESREFIAFAKDGALRMDRLIRDLLEYSRIGRDRPPMQTVALGEVMIDVKANLAVPLEESGAELEIVEPLPQVTGDRGELVRLLQNLLGNALKYRSPDRRPHVRLEARPSGEQWEISITDNGIGIPAEQRERIFGVFQRLHARDAYEGTGIGLAICRKILTHHGGRVWADDVEDGSPGSVFRFTLRRPS